MSHGHGADHGGGNKGIALLISVLALVLAFSETLGKSAQTAGLAYNIEASNLWAFFQAKTVRQTVLRTAAEQTAVSSSSEKSKKQVEKWLDTARRSPGARVVRASRSIASRSAAEACGAPR